MTEFYFNFTDLCCFLGRRGLVSIQTASYNCLDLPGFSLKTVFVVAHFTTRLYTCFVRSLGLRI